MKYISWTVACIVLFIALNIESILSNSNLTNVSTKVNEDSVIVMTEANFPPFEFIDENGKLVGFDIDVMNAIAKETGWNVEYISVGFSDIFTEIDNSKNIAIADIFISRERSEKFLFSKPYVDDFDSLVLNKSFKGVDYQQLKDLHICVEKESYQISVLEKLNFKNVEKCKNNTVCNEYFNKNMCYGIYRSNLVNLYYIKNNIIKNAFISDIFLHANNSNPSGILLNKNDHKKLAEINQALDKLSANGTLKKIKNKWFKNLTK